MHRRGSLLGVGGMHSPREDRRSFGSTPLKFKQRWSGRNATGVRCSRRCRKAAGDHSLCLVVGGAVLAVDSTAAVTGIWVSLLGSWGPRMRRWRPWCRAFIIEFINEFTRVRLSGGRAAKCSGCTCSHVPPSGRGPLRGDGGLAVAVLRGLQQQCRLGPSCLARPQLSSVTCSATTACAAGTVADLKPWTVVRQRT